MGKIAIFTPVWNEEETLATVLSRVPPMILGRKTEIFVVDDASEDRSAEIARKFAFYVGVLPKHSESVLRPKRGWKRFVLTRITITSSSLTATASTTSTS